ncbi:MAG: type VI secretion system baseplate subunit TssK [Planctomycetes bacterium]|nr:type VI secretion system baseplate subunit TssK [Planctomycetota bacterium]
MRNLPVHWAEGLFLRPHHLQAADRSWAETLETSGHWDHEYNYGLRKVELSEEAIANYQVQVDVCHGRMRDGTLISIDPGQELDRVDLKGAFASESVVQVFLAVPKLNLGRPNVATGAESGKHRYVESKLSLQDESAGGNDQEIALRALNVRVMLSTQDLQGYELLPLAQIQRSGEKEATPTLDQSYIPPVLAVDAWPPLGRDIVRAIHDIIGQKIEVLSQQVLNRNVTLVSQEPGDLDRLLMLSQLNAASTALGVLAFASGVHPLLAYTELCRIVGQLSIFSPERRPPEIPHYDHDDLARIFRYVKERIASLLEQIRDYEYEQRFFVGEGRGMRISLESKWLGADWQWFVGVSRGMLPEQQCLALLSPGELDWKLGSARQVDQLFEYGAEGLHLTPLPQAPRALPPAGDWLYFEVNRDNTAWKEVMDTETLAMRLKDTLIVNRADLQGERKLVVSVGGKQVALQFALFAVPKGS